MFVLSFGFFFNLRIILKATPCFPGSESFTGVTALLWRKAMENHILLKLLASIENLGYKFQKLGSHLENRHFKSEQDCPNLLGVQHLKNSTLGGFLLQAVELCSSRGCSYPYSQRMSLD